MQKGQYLLTLTKADQYLRRFGRNAFRTEVGKLTWAAIQSLNTDSLMDWSDQEAAEEARQGNPLGFRQLVDRHSRSVFRLAYRITANQHDAEDVVQETFLRAFKQLHRFDHRASFSTWIYRICMNCALDSLRSRKARLEHTATSRELANQLAGVDRLAAVAPSPERLMQSGEIGALLEPALQQLSERERIAFTLRHLEGCDIPEIARVLGVHDNAAKHSVFRAVQKLRRCLEPAWGPTR